MSVLSDPSWSDAPWWHDSAPALLCNNQCWSHARLHEMARERCASLRAQGLHPGQVVQVPDSPVPEVFLMQHALARAGAVLFPCRQGTEPGELDAMAADCGAEWRWDSVARILEPTGHARAEQAPAAPDLALFVRTSGSTGRARIVMLTSGNLLRSALWSNDNLGLERRDRWLTCLRLSHVGGLTISYRCALAGATVVLHDGFDVAAVNAALREQGITHLSVVPPMLARLLDLDARPPASLRVLLVGGQALSPVLARRAIEAGWPLYLSYGMTETGSQLATTSRLTELPPPGRISLPCPECEVQAVRCGETPARLRVRGALVMAGYANPARTGGDGLEDGWFEAPDLVCLEPDGALHVQGRADSIRVVAGNNVSLTQVTRVLESAPGVREAMVVALPEPVWGHRLIAVHAGTASEAELREWCARHLSGSAQPRGYLAVEQLPLLANGKYDRLAIERLARERFQPLAGAPDAPGQ